MLNKLTIFKYGNVGERMKEMQRGETGGQENTDKLTKRIKMFVKKPGKINEHQKEITILIIKIISVCIFAGVYSLLLIQGLYKEKDIVYWQRFLAPTILLIVPSVLLFIKIKIPQKLNIAISILFSCLVMVENFIMLQVSQGYQYQEFSQEIINLNMLIIFMIFMVLYAVFNSFKAAVIGLNIVTVVFGLANYFVIMFRGTGLLAVDILNIETAANVAGGYSYTLDFYTYLLLMSQIAISFLAMKLGKNTLTRKGWRVIPIVLAVVVVVSGYKTFMESDEYDKALKIKYFKPQETFNKNGMYVSFVKSIKDLMVEKPKGYSIDAVEKMAEEYKGTEATASQDELPNIIMIMDEAFTDFSSFTDFKISQDCMPFYHSLSDNAIKGQMFVSIFGGGTAATEFEALTSNSMAFIPNGITAYTTYINDPMASLTTTLKSQNYGGLLAMHPYKGSGYKRDKVYPLLGFNRFITMDDFADDTDRVGRHISDVGDVDRIISEYEDYKEENNGPFWMFNVTMQNHSPFTAEGVSDDIKLGYDINAPEAQQYVNLMKHTDDALKRIVEYFEGVDEPTIIVFYGDHQPKLEDEFYSEIKKGYNLDKIYRKLIKRNTQFVIWANYDIEEQSDVYISANYMSSLVLDTAGLAKSGYQEFVSKVREEVPILTKYGYIGKDGNFYKNGDKDSPYYDILLQYNILEYNNMFDVKNRVDSFFEVK
ncbi:MAG: sulfatase-like hydrolase/transferase [Eubacterium sp.]